MAETGDHITFECTKWEDHRKEVWIEKEYNCGGAGRTWIVATGRSRRKTRMENGRYGI